MSVPPEPSLSLAATLLGLSQGSPLQEQALVSHCAHGTERLWEAVYPDLVLGTDLSQGSKAELLGACFYFLC